MGSDFDSFNATGFDGFIDSGFDARGVGGVQPKGDLILVGTFSSFDGNTVDSICTYDFTTGDIDTTIGDQIGSFIGGSRRVLFHEGSGGLYFVSGTRLYRYSSDGFGDNINIEDWFEGCVWGDKIVVIGDDVSGNQIGVYDINADSFSTSEIPDPVATGIYDDVHLLQVKPITINGTEMLMFFGYQQQNFNGIRTAYCEIWNGSSYLYTLEDDYPVSGFMSTTSTWDSDTVVNGEDVWFTHRMTRTSTATGTNDHDYIVRWRPRSSNSQGWSRPAAAFQLGLVNPNIPNPPGLYINELNGSFYYTGAQTWEANDGSNIFSLRTVRLDQGFSASGGTSITDTGGYDTGVDFMEVLQGDAAGNNYLFASRDPAASAEITGGGSNIDGGATKRLIFFNGSVWDEFPAQPDNGEILAMLPLNADDIVDP